MAKIIILTISHGASHRRAAKALRDALVALEPHADVQVVDGLAYCARWFRAYYNSYQFPLKYWPGLWGWIEKIQHRSTSTSPTWLYRGGGRPLFDFLARERPDAVVATEVGMGELAALAKRSRQAQFRLIGVELTDFNRAWVQPEFDLYLTSHPDLAGELAAAGAPSAALVDVGHPIDVAFADPPPRALARARLGLDQDKPVVLVMFGGTGFGNPKAVAYELKRIPIPCEIVFIAGHNRRLEERLRQLSGGLASARALGWVDNVLDWMAAADLLISKPGGSTLFEAAACGLPMLAVHPLPGNERRMCVWLEKWRAGVPIRKSGELGATVEHLLSHREDLRSLRGRAGALARPRAAYDAARAVLDLAAVRP